MLLSRKSSYSVLFSGILLLAACGQKGPLMLEQSSSDLTTEKNEQNSDKPAEDETTHQQSTEAQ